MISPFPITALLNDVYTLESRSEEAVEDSKKKLLNYKEAWSTVAILYGRTKSVIGTWPKYKTNPNNTHVFYCEWNDDVQEGDRLTINSTSLYAVSINDPGEIHHHLEIQCFRMPDELTYESYSTTTDDIGGESTPTWTMCLTNIVARIDVPTANQALAAAQLGQSIQYIITVHATSLIELNGRLSFTDQFGETKYLKIKSIDFPDVNSPWMTIGAEDF